MPNWSSWRNGTTPKIVGEYFDEGISGVATDKRRGFLQMLNDAKGGKFKLILAWDQDRFSRLDSIDSGEVIAPLRRAGVRLVTCTQGEIDWNTFAGRLVFNVAQEGKNQFLHDLSRNMCRSLLQRGQAGELFAKPPTATSGLSSTTPAGKCGGSGMARHSASQRDGPPASSWPMTRRLSGAVPGTVPTIRQHRCKPSIAGR